jgi:AraC-like DNA-binding protein
MMARSIHPTQIPASLIAIKDGARTGMVRVGPLAAIPTVLEAAGVDAGALLAEFGLDLGLFTHPDNLIGVPTLGALVHRCVERTSCPEFGLLVGRCASISSLGQLGYLMQSSPTVGDALRELAGHMEVHDGGGAVTLKVAGDLAMLAYTIMVSGVVGRSQLNDASMAIGFNLLHGLCGPGWHLTGVQIARTRPDRIAPYVAHFGVAPLFGSEVNTLIFDRRWLDHALGSRDPVLHGMMRERIQEIEEHRREDLVGQIRRMLTPLIGTPDCRLELVASELGMSGRTLNRRLARDNLTFRDLLEDVQFEVACQLLQDTRMTALEVAHILGYSDGSAFTRAFSRWAGMGPIEWRRSKESPPSRAAHPGPPA